MPPTHPLSTPCRYGYNCTRRDCYYTHPKGMTRDATQLCSFGRTCFRKVCHLEHPNGRMMDQLRPGVDFCAACTLVRPAELGQVSAAFQSAFPAPDDGKDRCDFVAAVPMGVAFTDWKRYRGISVSGTPDGVPSTPEKIRLFPRTTKGESLLRDPANRVGMRWSPTPFRAWKTLERMVTHDQYWEQNQDMYVLCAGYESTTPRRGVCIELAVTDVVREEDGGEGGRAGARVAGEVLGLPGARDQKWFVFYISYPEEGDEDTQFVTIKTILDTSKLPARFNRPGSRPSSAPVPASSPLAAVQLPPRLPTAHATRPPSSGLTSAVAPTPPAAPSALPRLPNIPPIGTSVPGDPAALQRSMAVSYSSSAPGSTDSEFGSSALSFGSYMDENALPGVGPVTLPPPLTALPIGPGGVPAVRQAHENPVVVSVLPPVPAPVMDELNALLASLNMSKYREKFDKNNLDYKTLKMMTEEEQLNGIGIPLGPRIKLMKELGIERPNV